MSDIKTVAGNQAQPKTGANDEGFGGDLENLLSRPDLGVFVCGLVTSVDEPRRFQGKGKSGKDYDFTQRRIQVLTGNKLVDLSERLPDAVPGQPAPKFGKIQIGRVIRFRATNVRMNNGQAAFDVVTTG